MIIIQNIYDNECFKLCLVIYLHPAEHNSRRITKVNRDFEKELGFKDIKFPVKIRNIHKIEKKRNLSPLVFLVTKVRKYIQSVYQKNAVSKNILILLLIGEGKRHYVLIKGFSSIYTI